MEAPRTIFSFGDDDFDSWLQSQLQSQSYYQLDGHSSEISTIGEEVSKIRPRAVFVDLATQDAHSAIMAGVAAQKGFRWTSIVLLFSECEAELLSLVKQVRRRSWSLVGRETIENLGIERSLAGILTDDGLIDGAVTDLQTELYAQSLETSPEESTEEDDDEPEIEAA